MMIYPVVKVYRLLASASNLLSFININRQLSRIALVSWYYAKSDNDPSLPTIPHSPVSNI